jgi:hypothetical protein
MLNTALIESYRICVTFTNELYSFQINAFIRKYSTEDVRN